MNRRIPLGRRAATAVGVSLFLWALLGSGAAADHVHVSEEYPVTETATDALRPVVAWDGENFLVVWQSGTECTFGSQLLAARISASGEIMDTTPVVLDECEVIGAPRASVRVASAGNGFLVAWTRGCCPADEVRATVVRGDGTVDQPGGVVVARNANAILSAGDGLAVAADANGYLVAWANVEGGAPSIPLILLPGQPVVRAVRLDTKGQVLDNESFPVLIGAVFPAIASNGAAYLVVGMRLVNGGGACSPVPFPLQPCIGVVAGGDVVAARVTSGGTLLDPVPIAISPASSVVRPVSSPFTCGSLRVNEGHCPKPAAASDGTDFLVTWTVAPFRSGDPGANYQVVGGRVTFAGVPLDPAGISISPAKFPLWAADPQRSPRLDAADVAWGGSGYTVMWVNMNWSTGGIEGATVGADGDVHGPFDVVSYPRLRHKSVTAGPDGTVAVTYVRDRRPVLRFVGGETTTGTISGTVSDASDGSGGATVSVDTGQSATTASDGTYTIGDVPTGDRSVTASADGYDSQTKSATVSKDETTVVDFALQRSSTSPATLTVDSISYATNGSRFGDKHLDITVSVVDDGGAPVADASVSVDVDKGGSLYEAHTGTTGADGTVTFSAKNAPSGCYETTVTDVSKSGETWDGATPENGFCK